MRTLLTTLALFFLVGFLLPVNAYTIPEFPQCTNPQGTVKVQYESGTHGIPGDSTPYSGSDKVFQVTDDTLIQCLCLPDKRGIQTNWWKLNSLTESEIQQLKNLGWHYIPNGSDWGLDPNPYLAKNAEFSCGSTSTGGNSSNGTGGGQILSSAASTTGQVLGLAATGNIVTISTLALLGIFLLGIGIALKKFTH